MYENEAAREARDNYRIDLAIDTHGAAGVLERAMGAKRHLTYCTGPCHTYKTRCYGHLTYR